VKLHSWEAKLREPILGRPQMPMKRYSTQQLANILLLLVLCLGAALRFYRIQAQSLWNDEGTTVALVSRSLAVITQSAANDIHPPLYYYLLHFWTRLFGTSELAVRSMSAALGVLLVFFTAIFGRVTQGANPRTREYGWVGLIAAAFAALSPLQVHYSQEARMYMLTAFLATVATLALVRVLEYLYSGWQAKGRRFLWAVAAYVVISILLLHCHYFAVAVIAAHNLTFLVRWLVWVRSRLREGSGDEHGLTSQRHRGSFWQPVLTWLAIQAAIVLAYVPWLILAADQLRVWPAISQSQNLALLLTRSFKHLALGIPGAVQGGVTWVALAGILLAGTWALLLRVLNGQHTTASAAVLCHYYVPIGVLYLLSLRRPMYDPKFLLLCTPALHLLMAEGILALARLTTRICARVRIAVVLAFILSVAVLSATALAAYYWDPRYARDDYRGIAQYIEAVGQPGDAILVNAPAQVETFAYYYRGTLPVHPLPSRRPLDEAETLLDLQRMAQGKGRVFAILWATDESDPQRYIEGWLDQNAYKATDSWFGNVRLVTYAVPVQGGITDIQHPRQVDLDNQVRFLGYSLLTPEVKAGDIVQLTLFWEAIRPVDERYKVFTHILDAHGHLVGQRDAEPGGGANITTIWPVGTVMADNYGLPVLPAVPPGEYSIEIGMYSLTDGHRLPVIEQGQPVTDHILLQPVRVVRSVPPPLVVLAMQEPVHVTFGDVTLLGYSMSKLGSEHAPETPIRPGDVLHLTLFWQANQQPTQDLVLVLRLQGADAKVYLEQRAEPTAAEYPVTQWQPAEIVRDQHHLYLPAELPRQLEIWLAVYGLPTDRAIGSPVHLTDLRLQ